MTTCECGRPTSGGLWCTKCRHTVAVAVANIAAYHDDLETVRTRQTRFGGLASKGSVGKTMPLGIDMRFTPDGTGTKAYDAARLTVTTWARRMLDEIPGLRPPTWPRLDTVRAACQFFEANLTKIAASPWAPAFKVDVLAVERALSRIVDRPAEGWYAGECGSVGAAHDASSCACACHQADGLECDMPGGCGREYDNVTCRRVLYADPDDPFVRCRDCGATYDVDERRDHLLTEAEDRLATVETIARIVTTLGKRDLSTERVSARIRQWSTRGRITSHGTRVVDGRERPLYRIGDVIDLLEKADTKTA